MSIILLISRYDFMRVDSFGSKWYLLSFNYGDLNELRGIWISNEYTLFYFSVLQVVIDLLQNYGNCNGSGINQM